MAEEHSLTHAGVDSFCQSIQYFVDKVCAQISKKVEASLLPSVDSQHVQEALAACSPGDLFAGLKSRYNREKYYCDHFNYVVREISAYQYSSVLPSLN